MPEAPEVFFLKEILKKKLKNLTLLNITGLKIDKSKVINVDAKGKLLWIETEKYFVHLHMMITGWVVFEEPKFYKYKLEFDEITMYIEDSRKLSKVSVLSEDDHDIEINEKMGISILSKDMTQQIFMDILKNSKKNIATFLLDQQKICGIGNYIRCESLYLSKISPFHKANELSDDEYISLYKNIRFVIFSNLYEMMENEKIKIPKSILSLQPENVEVPYVFRVYGKKQDLHGNTVIHEDISGRTVHYVKEIQK